MYAVNQYDAVAESYDSLFKDKASIEENRKIASMLFEVSGIFLDVGCGTGLLLDILKVSPDEYWGIDPSSKMLDVFRKKHPERQNRNSVRKCIAKRMNLSGRRQNVLKKVWSRKELNILNLHVLIVERLSE